MKLNQSKIKMFTKCGEQYRRRYVEGEVIPPGIALIRGSAVHRGSEHNFTQKLQSGVDLPASEVEEAAMQTFHDKIRNEGLSLSEEELAKGKDAIVNEGERAVRTLSMMYSDRVAPRYQPIAVEETLEYELPSGLIMTGILDTVATGHRIVDLKTMGKAPSAGQYDNDPQVTNYWLLHWAKYGVEPTEMLMECLIDTKTPKQETVSQTRRKEDIEAFINQAEAVAGAIQAGTAIPAYGQDGAWWCSKRWCGYWSTCPFVPAHKRA